MKNTKNKKLNSSSSSNSSTSSSLPSTSSSVPSSSSSSNSNSSSSNSNSSSVPSSSTSNSTSNCIPRMTRPCDNMICSICLNSLSFNDISYRIVVPFKKLNKLKEKTKDLFFIKWNCLKNFNYFHMNCWNNLKENLENNLKRNLRKNNVELNIMNETEETIERFDTIEQLYYQMKDIAQLFKLSHHTVVFTGAGISVSAGMPTYRGAEGIDTIEEFGGIVSSENNTNDNNNSTTNNNTTTARSTTTIIENNEPPSKKQKTTKVSKSKKNKKSNEVEVIEVVDLVNNEEKKEVQEEENDEENEKVANEGEEEDLSYERLQPTYTHKALTLLQQNNYLHYCITQNCDNLHLKSNFPRDLLTELHGNVFCEYCENCKHEYYRDYAVDQYSTDCSKEPWYVRCPQCHWNHYTGRKCTQRSCRGKLRDTIVNFGDDLHETLIGGYDKAEKNCKESDLCLTLGSSLTVSPANSLPLLSKQIIICNLQVTDLDLSNDVKNKRDDYIVRCWTTSDIFMRLLLNEIGLIVPE